MSKDSLVMGTESLAQKHAELAARVSSLSESGLFKSTMTTVKAEPNAKENASEVRHPMGADCCGWGLWV